MVLALAVCAPGRLNKNYSALCEQTINGILRGGFAKFAWLYSVRPAS